MIGGPDGARQGWFGRMVDSFARVRTGLLTIIVITTLLLLWLIISFWLDAYVQRRDAVRTLVATEIDAALWHLALASSRELVVSETLLSRREGAAEEDLNWLERARRDTDDAIADVGSFSELRDFSRSAGALAAFEARTAAMVETRGLVDALIAKERQERDVEKRRVWWSAHTGSVDALGRLKAATRFRPETMVYAIEAQLDLAQAFFGVHVALERKRALVTGWIASEMPPPSTLVVQLAEEKGRFHQAQGALAAFLDASLTRDADLQAKRQAQTRFLDDFEQEVDRIIQVGLSGGDPGMQFDSWIARSAPAVSSVTSAAETATATAYRLADARVAHGTRRLVIDTMVVLVTLACAIGAVWIVMKRIIRPLEEISTAMRSVADGAEIADIPGTDRYGEIGDMARSVAVFKEATDAKSDEFGRIVDDLRVLNETLEARVAERTRDAEVARDDAIGAGKAKNLFLANMSHELRTPLNAIIGFSEILCEEAGERGDEAAAGDLRRIGTSARHLLDLIEGVLDVSRIEVGKMDVRLEPVEVRAIVEEARAAAETLATRNRNRLTIECGEDVGVVETDRVKLRRIVGNLLDNACKFTRDGQVSLTVSRAAGEARDSHGGARDELVVEITDTGIGMTEEECGRVFEAFAQADGSATRRYGGAGLGLTVTRAFCRRLGGEVDVKSDPGRGSIFTVRLPVAPREGYPAAPLRHLAV